MKRLRILRPCEKLVPSLHVLDETMKRSSCFITEYNMGVVVLFSANSLVNHIIYSLRTPGFREGLLQLVCRVPDLSHIAPANLPLRNLRRAQIDGRKTIDEVCFLNNFNLLAEQHAFPLYFLVSNKILSCTVFTIALKISVHKTSTQLSCENFIGNIIQSCH